LYWVVTVVTVVTRYGETAAPKFEVEGKIKGGIVVIERRRRRRRKLLDDLKKRRGYCHLKEEALDRTMWRARFGRGFEHVVRQTAK
jgi:hypothetical protein